MTSIRRHLVAWLALGLGGLLTLAGSALFLHLRSGLQHDFDGALTAKALAIATLSKFDGIRVELDFADEFMTEFERPEDPEYFQLWDATGLVIERSRSLGQADLPMDAGNLELPRFWDQKLPDGRRGRAVGFRFVSQVEISDGMDSELPYQTGAAPELILVVARSRTDFDQTLATIRFGMVFTGGGLLVAAMVIVFGVVRGGLRPLQRVGSHAANLDADRLDRLFPVADLPRELQPICERLNDLLGRLGMAFQHEKRLTADIAHELRTPLAELRALNELALKWPDEGGAPVHGKSLSIALRMEAIVGALLALARCEQRPLTVASQEVDMGSLLLSERNRLAETARLKRLQISFQTPECLSIRSDPQMLRLLVSNLLQNAVAYTPTGGWIVSQLSAGVPPGGFRWTLANRTDELTEEDLPKLFDRFWRKDAARSAPEHAGLGLPLARALATALALELRAEIPEAGAVSFILSG